MAEKKKLPKGCIWLVALAGLAFIIFLVSDKVKSERSLDALSATQQDSARRSQVVLQAFSEWDGSHKNLVAYVKKNMNDPSSFQHVQTRYIDNGSDTLAIKMEYRGKNAFGATMLGHVTATAKLNGELIDINAE